MCVIIVKPANAELPSNSILERASIYNPHGFGFCTSERIYKTLSFEAFKKELRKVRLNEQCIIHFRYATTGSVKRANCHPFKDAQTGICFAHNGVLKIAAHNDMTDSETFFKQLIGVINAYGYNSQEVEYHIEKSIDYSKFAFMNSNKIHLYGDFKKIDGIYYSNTTFLNYYYPDY